MMIVGSKCEHRVEMPMYVTSSHGITDDQMPATYAELMPLQPLSPVRGNIDTSVCVEPSGIHFYDYLEPLKPIAMVNDSGQFEPCVQPSGPSPINFTFGSTPFILPPAADNSGFKISWSDSVQDYTSQSNDSVKSTFSQPVQPQTVQYDISWGSPSHLSAPSATSASTLSGVGIGVGDEDEIDTADVAERVTAELRRFNISQSLFAQTVLNRSQGTLSELLRNPKPWSKMKTGRETYVRMYQWLREPESQRLAVLHRAKLKASKMSF